MGLLLPRNAPPFLELRHQKYFSFSEIFEINKAYTCAWAAHFGHERMDGSLYIAHPIAMTLIAMEEFGIYDCEINVTIILHDTNEPSVIPFFNVGIKILFGETIAENNRLLTKTDINKPTYLQEIIASKNWKVIFVKLVDRLHNMRTLEKTTQAFQKKQAVETRTFFLSLCDELSLVIPKKYKKIPEKIKLRLIKLCEQYGY